MTRATLRLATRGSPLALAQARRVAEALTAESRGELAAEIVVLETVGDRHQQVPIHDLGGQGVFVKEVEAAVLDGRADAAVHSAKDLPAAPGLSPLPIVAVLARADARDALVGRRLDQLPPGARVATGSVRRRAQLAWLRRDLTFAELRGNVGTRLGRIPDGGAIVVAMAALDRLGRAELAAQVLSPAEMLPQVGQGAIAVCGRPGDDETAHRLAVIDHPATRRALLAERAYLAAVGGGCDLPVGAYATCEATGPIRLEAMIASLDGHVVVRESEEGTDPDELGASLAVSVLEGGGGAALLGRVSAGYRR